MDGNELTNGSILYTNGKYEKYLMGSFKVLEVCAQVV